MMFNIFTDGAASNNGGFNKNKPIESASAYIIDDAINHVTICRNAVSNGRKTNNFSELYAIYLALYDLDNYLKGLIFRRTKIKVNVYSDSMLCINTFKRWWKQWWKNSGKDFDRPWYTSSGSEVANQDVIKATIKQFILNDRYDINFIHISAHIDISNPKKLKKAKNLFEKINNVNNINIEYLQEILFRNSLCDKMATNCIDIVLKRKKQL